MNGETQQFGIYDEKEIYEFNYIGKHRGDSSIEYMKDFYLFGQDYGEKSYFFDPFDKLGYGIDAVWRVDRCSCEKQDFELVAKDFYELVEKFCDKKDEDLVRPFENERDIQEGISINQFLADNVESDPALMEKINMMQEKIREYYNVMIANGIKRVRIKEVKHFEPDEEDYYRIPETQNIPLEALYLIQKNIYTLSYFDKHFFVLCVTNRCSA